MVGTRCAGSEDSGPGATAKPQKSDATQRVPTNDDTLRFLLALNHACAEKEKSGQKITPPGLPLPPEEHAAFITTHCIEAPTL